MAAAMDRWEAVKAQVDAALAELYELATRVNRDDQEETRDG
jgi:hypothetical protein